MIYGFVRQSGGQVRIYSEVGQGHDHVPLPAAASWARPRPTTSSRRTETAPSAAQGETVLVVDDEPTVRMLMAEVLEELGYTAWRPPTARRAQGPAVGRRASTCW